MYLNIFVSRGLQVLNQLPSIKKGTFVKVSASKLSFLFKKNPGAYVERIVGTCIMVLTIKKL